MSLVANGSSAGMLSTGEQEALPAEPRDRGRGEAEADGADREEPDEVDPSEVGVDAASSEQRRRVEASAADHHLGREDVRPGGDRHRDRRHEIAEDLTGIGADIEQDAGDAGHQEGGHEHGESARTRSPTA